MIIDFDHVTVSNDKEMVAQYSLDSHDSKVIAKCRRISLARSRHVVSVIRRN